MWYVIAGCVVGVVAAGLWAICRGVKGEGREDWTSEGRGPRRW
jgi:hypothetical protein